MAWSFGLLSLLLVAAVGVVAWSQHRGKALDGQVQADLMVVEKSQRRLSLYRNGNLLKSYTVALGRAPVGHKTQEGDRRTPEGQYTIDYRKEDSGFHRALHISYPNAADIRQAQLKQVSPGGAIMIHGLKNGRGWLGNLHRLTDWTAGCVAVTDWEIEEIWRAVPNGTAIEIKP